MTRFYLFILALSFMAILFYNAAVKAAPGKGHVVVELFTSQSCSSCPAADKQLEKLAQNPDIIALGFHVTYWDHLNWKDTLSQEFSTNRQNDYAAFKGTRGVYTPQMIVNGGREFVGSSEVKIKAALKDATSVAPITLIKNEAKLTIELPTVSTGSYTLWLASVQSHYTQAIPSGENSGETVQYTNAVLDFRSIGEWNGAQGLQSINIPAINHADSWVVLAQKDGLGPVVAAGKF